MISEKMLALGKKSSAIREIFEYGKKRKAEIGEENVFDFSLGNPSVCPPPIVNETIKMLAEEEDPVLLHGYTSAPGDMETRKATQNDKSRCAWLFPVIYPPYTERKKQKNVICVKRI